MVRDGIINTQIELAPPDPGRLRYTYSQVRCYAMAYSLADLDAMTIQQAQALPFDDKGLSLDLIITDGLNQATETQSYRVGLYCDYFEGRPGADAQGQRPQAY